MKKKTINAKYGVSTIAVMVCVCPYTVTHKTESMFGAFGLFIE